MPGSTLNAKKNRNIYAMCFLNVTILILLQKLISNRILTMMQTSVNVKSDIDQFHTDSQNVI